jgi:hypothetical protein
MVAAGGGVGVCTFAHLSRVFNGKRSLSVINQVFLFSADPKEGLQALDVSADYSILLLQMTVGQARWVTFAADKLHRERSGRPISKCSHYSKASELGASRFCSWGNRRYLRLPMCSKYESTKYSPRLIQSRGESGKAASLRFCGPQECELVASFVFWLRRP